MREFDKLARQPLGATEKAELRRPNAKVFDLGQGRRKLIQTQAPVHFTDARGRLQDIDLTPSETKAQYRVANAPYVLIVRKDSGTVTYQGRETQRTITARCGAKTGPAVEDGVFVWDLGDRKAVLIPRPGGIRLETLLLNASAEPTEAWVVEGGDPGDVRGIDADWNIAETGDGRFTGRVRKVMDREWSNEPVWPVRLF